MVDAYMMYLFENEFYGSIGLKLTFRNFVGTIAYELCTNHLSDSSSLRKRKNRDFDEDTDDDENDQPCILIPIKLICANKEGKQVRKRCTYCNEKIKASYWCKKCSKPNKIIAVCGFGTKNGESCFKKHLESLNN